MGERLRLMFVRQNISSGVLVQARSGARRHLIWMHGYNTVCGKNHVAMQMITRDNMWMTAPPGLVGQARRDEIERLERISKADLMLENTTCDDCRLKVTALMLMSEDEERSGKT